MISFDTTLRLLIGALGDSIIGMQQHSSNKRELVVLGLRRPKSLYFSHDFGKDA